MTTWSPWGSEPGRPCSFIRNAAAAPSGPASVPQGSPADASQAPPASVRLDMQLPVPLDYQSQLREGRRLAAKGSWPEAAAAFAAALHAKQDDAAALSELSFAELSLHRLVDAEAHAKRALAQSSNPSLKAANLYNLGRIAEAQLTSKEPETVKKAADYYRQSLKLRQSEEVLSRLFQLDEHPEVLPCTEPRPFKELLACMKRIFHLEDQHIEIHNPAESVVALKIKFQPEDFFYQFSDYLAVQTAAGWQVFLDLGRSRRSHRHDELIIVRKGVWGASGNMKSLQIDYSTWDYTIHIPLAIDDFLGLREYACKTAPSSCEELLDYSITHEITHRLFYAFSETGIPTRIGDVAVRCKESIELTIFPDLSKSWPAPINRQIDQWIATHQSSSSANPMLGPDGKLKGTELRADRLSGSCPKAVAIK